ncbi:hypothetical protein [Faecalicatena contorta]|uniref:hypothetical protein n=1 Tax=Faecalicatena contorta TaxID=39482 RepID=UPI001F1DCF9B|nr:hypothetical protein [Faecalicatena contorta]
MKGPWFRSKNGVAFYNGIRQGKIEAPKLHDIIPGTFREYEGIRIKFQEIRYEGIQIGGMAARITR